MYIYIYFYFFGILFNVYIQLFCYNKCTKIIHFLNSIFFHRFNTLSFIFFWFLYLLYFFFASFCYLHLIALYSAFKHFYSPNFKQYLKVTVFLISFLFFNFFFASICLFFLLRSFYFLSWYFSKIQALVLLHTSLLVILHAIFFRATFAIESWLYLNFSSKLAI